MLNPSFSNLSFPLIFLYGHDLVIIFFLLVASLWKKWEKNIHHMILKVLYKKVIDYYLLHLVNTEKLYQMK